MTLLEVLALAVLQGLTEFIPVSSSGHLVLAGSFFNLQEVDSLAFIIALHLATVAAAAVFYHRDVRDLLTALIPPYRGVTPRKKRSQRVLMLVTLATLPTALVGLSLGGYFEELFREPRHVVLSLLFTGSVLMATSKIPPGEVALEDLPWWKALLVGLAQGAAIVPGISRSGITIAALLFLGLRRPAAVEFSFLLLLPATLGATILEAGRVTSLTNGDLLQLCAGFFVAAVVGYASIYLVLRWTREGNLWHFGLYCWFVAAAAAAAVRLGLG